MTFHRESSSELTQYTIRKAFERSQAGMRDAHKGTYLEEVADEVLDNVRFERSADPDKSREISVAFIAEVISLMQSHRADQIYNMDASY